MEITKSVVVSSLLWKFLERCSVQAIQFVITILLARKLLPNEYGIIALIMVFVNIFQVLVDGGFNTALIQKKKADNIDFSTIFYFGIGMSAFLYFVLFLIAPIISSFYSQPELIPVIRVVGLVLFVHAIVAVQNSYVSRHMLFRKMFICSLISVIISGTIGIAMAYMNYGVWALVAQVLASQMVLAVTMFFVLKWRPEFYFSFLRLKQMLKYGWKIFMTNIVVTIFVNIRKLIIGHNYKASSLAYFERGEHFPNFIMSNINTSIQAVMFPTFAKEQSDRVRVKQILRRSTQMSCFVIYPLMMFLIVSAKPLTLLLLTDKWLPAVPFMQIFCIANFFRPITIPNLEAIKALGYSGLSLKLEIIKKILDTLILIISCFYGVYAIAWGIVLFNFICVFINLYPNKKILGYGIYEQIKDATPTLLLTIATGFMVFWLQFWNVPNMLIVITQLFLGALLYLLLCYAVRVDSLFYLLNMIKSKFFK